MLSKAATIMKIGTHLFPPNFIVVNTLPKVGLAGSHANWTDLVWKENHENTIKVLTFLTICSSVNGIQAPHLKSVLK